MTKQEFKKLPSGDVEGVMVYPSTKVTIQINGRESEIGEQPEYEVKQIIKKEKINDLLEYLRQQKDHFAHRLKSAQEVLDKTEHIDIDKLQGALLSLPEEVSKKSKKLASLNKLAEDYYMKSGALKNMKILEENLAKIEEQIQFLQTVI